MVYILSFFFLKKSDLKLNISDLKFDISIVKETVSLGFVTLSRQAAVSLTVLVVNNILFSLQGEAMIAVYAIISRLLMFMLFPILGITQGFIPIAGYNFGAQNKDRVLNSVKKAIIYSTGMATVNEIAEAVFFLSLEESSYITGQVLHVNGGLTM